LSCLVARAVAAEVIETGRVLQSTDAPANRGQPPDRALAVYPDSRSKSAPRFFFHGGACRSGSPPQRVNDGVV
jgi:hypothetical protein